MSLNLSPCCHTSLPYIIVFNINIIHQTILTTSSHTSCCRHCHCCHHCNVDFVVSCNVTCYTNSLVSCICANVVYLLNVNCTLVATCTILGRLAHILEHVFRSTSPSLHPQTTHNFNSSNIIGDESKCLLGNNFNSSNIIGDESKCLLGKRRDALYCLMEEYSNVNGH